jgi:hypothetical protein
MTVSGVPGTTVTGPAIDNGDGTYTFPVSVDPSSGNDPGVVIGQPGRPPIVVGPKAKKHDCRKCKWLVWLLVLAVLILALLLLLT